MPDRLSLNEALLLAAHVSGERARMFARAHLLHGLRAHLPIQRTPAQDARVLALELREPGDSGLYSECLKAIAQLSRRQQPPSEYQIERVLRARN